MKKISGKLLTLTTAALVLCSATVGLAEEAPVKIAFDSKSKRMDIVTETTLPDYTQAQRGSVQFFFARLDSPDSFVNYTHDGIRKAEIKALRTMEKVDDGLADFGFPIKAAAKTHHEYSIRQSPSSPSIPIRGNRTVVYISC